MAINDKLTSKKLKRLLGALAFAGLVSMTSGCDNISSSFPPTSKNKDYKVEIYGANGNVVFSEELGSKPYLGCTRFELRTNLLCYHDKNGKLTVLSGNYVVKEK